MRAMRFGRFGGPGALEEADVPDPLAGPGESVIQVEVAGVNFGDIKQIAGEHTDGPYAPKAHCPVLPAWKSSAGPQPANESSATSRKAVTPPRRLSPTATWSRCRRGGGRSAGTSPTGADGVASASVGRAYQTR